MSKSEIGHKVLLLGEFGMGVIQKAIESYIDYCHCESEFTKRSLERYEYVLLVYKKFLLDELGLNDVSIFPYLRGLTHKEILEALDYYITRYGVKAEDTALLCVSVIKEFLKYLVQCEIIENSSIIDSFGRSDRDEAAFNYHYTKHMKELISKGVIKESTEGIPLNEEQIRGVVSYCDKALEALSVSGEELKEDEYNRCVSALITKIVVLTGVSVNKRIFDLTLDCIDMESGYLTINGYRVCLPFRLRSQFLLYLGGVYKGNQNNPKEFLFAQYDGKMISSPNVIGNFIGNVLKRPEMQEVGLKPTSTICLAKYAIVRLFDLGIDRDTIEEFTGYKETVISSCKQYSDAGKESENKRIVTDKLKTLPLFDTL